MISNAFGTAMPSAGSWNCNAVAAPNNRQAHSVGDKRKTPGGTLLPGTCPDTRWRHSRRYETPDQWFVGKVAELIDCIEPHRDFVKNLRASGGRASVLIQFLGDGYFGDEIPRD